MGKYSKILFYTGILVVFSAGVFLPTDRATLRVVLAIVGLALAVIGFVLGAKKA